MQIYQRLGFGWLEIILIVLVLAVIVAILYPVFAPSHRHGQGHPPQNSCIQHQRQLAIAILSNASDNDETLTLPAGWIKTTNFRSDPKVCNCPDNRYQGTPDDPDYGMNAFLYGVDPLTGEKYGLPMGDIPDPTIIELTTDINGPTSTTSQTLNGLPTNPFPGSYTVNGFFGNDCNADWRHIKNIVVSYLDGHVALIRSENLSSGRRTQYNIPVENKRRLSGNGG